MYRLCIDKDVIQMYVIKDINHHSYYNVMITFITLSNSTCSYDDIERNVKEYKYKTLSLFKVLRKYK